MPVINDSGSRYPDVLFVILFPFFSLPETFSVSTSPPMRSEFSGQPDYGREGACSTLMLSGWTGSGLMGRLPAHSAQQCQTLVSGLLL